MALSALHTWVPGELLKSADLNGEFANIRNNPIALISPTTGAINFNLSTHFSLVPGAITASSGTAGQALIVSGTQAVWGAPLVSSTSISPSGSTGQVLAITSSGSPPAFQVIPPDGGLSTTLPTAGMVYYISTAATPILLGRTIGTSGQVFTVSTSGVPVWAAPSAASGNSVLDVATANVNVVNTTAETTIYTFSVPGGSLGSSGMLRLTIQGNERIVANSHLTRLKFGTTSATADTIHSAVAIATSTPYLLSALISADGATNAQVNMLTEEVATSAAIVYMTKGRGLSTADSTVAQTLAVTLEWEVASTGNDFFMERATLERLI